MSLAMFQRAVVELTLAPLKARALRDGDADVLVGYELTERERERLVGIVGQAGISVSCSLSRGNRFEVIFQTFPMTCVVLKPVLRELVDEIWETTQPTNYQLVGEETAFVELLKRRLAAGEIDLPYVEDVFGYELACMELTRQSRESVDAVGETMVDFHCDPDVLLPPLSRLQSPPVGLPKGLYRVRVSLRDDQFEFEGVSQSVSALAA